MKLAHHPQGATLERLTRGELPEAVVAIISAHVEVCSECRQKHDQLRQDHQSRRHNVSSNPPEGGVFEPSWSSVRRSILRQIDRLRASLRPLNGERQESAAPGAEEPARWCVREAEGFKVVQMSQRRTLPAIDLGRTELTLVLDAWKSTSSTIDVAHQSPLLQPLAITSEKTASVPVRSAQSRSRPRGLLSWFGQPLAGT